MGSGGKHGAPRRLSARGAHEWAANAAATPRGCSDAACRCPVAPAWREQGGRDNCRPHRMTAAMRLRRQSGLWGALSSFFFRKAITRPSSWPGFSRSPPDPFVAAPAACRFIALVGLPDSEKRSGSRRAPSRPPRTRATLPESASLARTLLAVDRPSLAAPATSAAVISGCTAKAARMALLGVGLAAGFSGLAHGESPLLSAYFEVGRGRVSSTHAKAQVDSRPYLAAGSRSPCGQAIGGAKASPELRPGAGRGPNCRPAPQRRSVGTATRRSSVLRFRGPHQPLTGVGCSRHYVEQQALGRAAKPRPGDLGDALSFVSRSCSDLGVYYAMNSPTRTSCRRPAFGYRLEGRRSARASPAQLIARLIVRCASHRSPSTTPRSSSDSVVRPISMPAPACDPSPARQFPIPGETHGACATAYTD